jgi:hypothetical protein
MMNIAGTPEPTAARIRGAAPNISRPAGNSVETTCDFVGAINTTPVAKPESHTSQLRAMSPARVPISKYTVPSASQATLSTAPAKKKTRNAIKFQPELSAHHSAPDPTAKSAIAIVQANSCGWRRRNQRSNVLRVNAHAMRVAAPAKAEFNSLCTDWAAMISVTLLVMLLVMLKAKLMGAG